jgi:hypothetical protein
MARYGAETSLPPRRVLRLAREFFGPESAWGLALSSDTLTGIGFHGAGGTVEVSASPRVGTPEITEVTILCREFDPAVEEFLGVLAEAGRGPSLIKRVWRRIFPRTGGHA